MSKTSDENQPIKRLNAKGLEQLFLSKTQNPETTQQSENNIARPEMHMFLRPYFLLDKHVDRMTGLDTKETVIVHGKPVERRWCVTPDREYGMPGAFDRDVLLAIYEIAYEEYISKNMPVPEVMSIGPLRSFCRRLGLTYSGRTAKDIKQSLKRLAYTMCKSENSFFDKKRSLFLCESFKLLRGVGVTGEVGGDGNVIETSFVKFDEYVLSNLNSRYLMVVDLKYLRTLKTDIGKHLYPLLSHWLWRSLQEGYWRVEYKWLATHLGIKTWDIHWRAKQQLEAANEELKNKKYISHYEWDGWHLRYFPGEVFEAEQMRRGFAKKATTLPSSVNTAKPPKEAIDSSESLIPLLNVYAQGLPLALPLLKQKGITEAQAQALCIEKGIKTIKELGSQNSSTLD